MQLEEVEQRSVDSIQDRELLGEDWLRWNRKKEKPNPNDAQSLRHDLWVGINSLLLWLKRTHLAWLC